MVWTAELVAIELVVSASILVLLLLLVVVRIWGFPVRFLRVRSVIHPHHGYKPLISKTRTSLVPWENHGVHLACLQALCKGPCATRGGFSLLWGVCWALVSRSGLAWFDMADAYRMLNSLELVGTRAMLTIYSGSVEGSRISIGVTGGLE